MIRARQAHPPSHTAGHARRSTPAPPERRLIWGMAALHQPAPGRSRGLGADDRRRGVSGPVAERCGTPWDWLVRRQPGPGPAVGRHAAGPACRSLVARRDGLRAAIAAQDGIDHSCGDTTPSHEISILHALRL